MEVPVKVVVKVSTMEVPTVEVAVEVVVKITVEVPTVETPTVEFAVEVVEENFC